ncbi:hypothetical protein EYZ11_007631 [Aspergillus tanneri]|nr:hypothetical protein EYZ11_007631 [Aspergillus tanneri]
MQDSWESGDFWIAYAARNNFAFDLIYWHKIDQLFFQPTSSSIDDVWKQRLDFLELEERADIAEALNGQTQLNKFEQWFREDETVINIAQDLTGYDDTDTDARIGENFDL